MELIINIDFMTIKKTAEKWNFSVRRVQTICNEGMVLGVRNLVIHRLFLMILKGQLIRE